MPRLRTILKALAIATVVALAFPAIYFGIALYSLSSISRSHVDGNIPAPGAFDALMRRDLKAYFEPSLGPAVSIDYELLRDGPTQTGTGFPKFYVWAHARSANGERIGAATVAAVSKRAFNVRDFVTRDEARADPAHLRTIFPAPVAEKIDARASGR